MKDKGPFSLRSHRALFDRINARFHLFTPDEIWEIVPSKIYAETLIAWLKNDIGKEQVQRYLDVFTEVRNYEEIDKHKSDKVDSSIYRRMTSLAYILAREFDLFQNDTSIERELEVWHSEWSLATRLRERYHLNPHRPDLSASLNYPIFHIVEQELSPEKIDSNQNCSKIEKVLLALEHYRSASMSYSLKVSSPLINSESNTELSSLLIEENELLELLRGAFFLIHYEFIPDHFRLFSTTEDEFIGDDPKSKLNLENRKEGVC